MKYRYNVTFEDGTTCIEKLDEFHYSDDLINDVLIEEMILVPKTLLFNTLFRHLININDKDLNSLREKLTPDKSVYIFILNDGSKRISAIKSFVSTDGKKLVINMLRMIEKDNHGR